MHPGRGGSTEREVASDISRWRTCTSGRNLGIVHLGLINPLRTTVVGAGGGSFASGVRGLPAGSLQRIGYPSQIRGTESKPYISACRDTRVGALG